MDTRITVILILIAAIQNGISQENVSMLEGTPGFRSVNLQWRYPTFERAIGFSINYCENQAWGKHRCKKKILENPEGSKDSESNFQTYETELINMRMATNYTVEVKPFLGTEELGRFSRGRSIGTELLIQTKGFSARAINCLANTSLVEVETGPRFGGKISVEGTTDERCSMQGDYSPTRTSYLLSINHYICGSQIFNTSVRTFVIVQENLPILTHSTRRFMVLCNYIPETFTVRAGVNLPDDRDSPSVLVPVDTDVAEVDPSELFDSTNSLFASKSIRKEVGRALKLSAISHKDEEPRKWSHLALMIVMIISALVGMVMAVWQIFKKSTSRRNGDISYSNDSSVISGISGSLGNSSIEGAFNPEAYHQTSRSCALYENSDEYSESSQTEGDEGSLIDRGKLAETVQNNHCAVIQQISGVEESNWRLKNEKGDVFIIDESAI